MYPDDGSLLTGQATSGTIKGTLTRNSVAETGESVRFTNTQGIVSTAKTTSAGAFTNAVFPKAAFP